MKSGFPSPVSASTAARSARRAILQLPEQLDRELPGLGLLQLVERKRRVGRQPPSPAGPGVEERRAGQSEQQDRQIAEPRGE
jgi:nucleoid DNA-binding protein